MTARLAAAMVGMASLGAAQTAWWTHRGFLENRTLYYPWEPQRDRAQLVNETFLRFESAFRLPAGFTLFAGIDAQTDSHKQVERAWRLSWDGRAAERPPLAVRTLNLQYARGPFRIEAGKQVLHWGVMELFSPTDRFAPGDYLSPSGSDYLGVFAVRAAVDTGPRSLELVYLPRFTPSRIPLAGQRWNVPAAEFQAFEYRLQDVRYPGGPQFGARYHRIGSPFEYSVCFFEGFENLPSLPYQTDRVRQTLDYRIVYPKMRMVGADFTAPWRGLLWKVESSYLISSSSYLASTAIYQAQVEKGNEKWKLAVGFTGEKITGDRRHDFPNLGRAVRQSVSGHAAWTPSPKQTLSSEWFVHPNGGAFVTRILYSRTLASSVRGAAGWIWIDGKKTDPFGRYHVNSYLTLQLRYSF